MKVKDLRELIATWPDDALVVMSSDSEGNSYSPLCGWADGVYVAESTYSGTFYDKEDFESEVAEEYVEAGSEVQAYALWPTN